MFALSHLHLVLTSWKAASQDHSANPEREPLTTHLAVVQASGTWTQSCLGLMAFWTSDRGTWLGTGGRAPCANRPGQWGGALGSHSLLTRSLRAVVEGGGECPTFPGSPLPHPKNQGQLRGQLRGPAHHLEASGREMDAQTRSQLAGWPWYLACSPHQPWATPG